MVGIVILNYNNSVDTINCIDSILKHNTYPIKIVVVDNGSENKKVVDELFGYFDSVFKREYLHLEETEVTSHLPLLTFLTSSVNSGYAQGNNKGVKVLYKDSDVDKILILNSDILFVEDVIPGLVDDLDRLPNAAIVSPILYKKDLKSIDYTCARKALTLSQLFISYLFLFRDFGGILSKIDDQRNLLKNAKTNIVEIQLPSGSCMLMNKEFFKNIGSFDPHTFLYCEEDILFAKMRGLNKKNYLDTTLRCIHLGATTTLSKVSSRFILECSIQSNHYYLKTYTQADWIYLFCMRIFYFLLRIKSSINRKRI